MKLLLKIVFATGLIVVLAVAALAITLVYVDPNDYKDSIANKIKEETGRDIQIEGDINLSYYPWLGLDVAGITVSNAKGFADEPFLQTKIVNARVKLLPLLRKEVEMDTFILHGATINLAKNEQGVTNWDDLVKSEEAAEESEGPSPLAALVLGGIDIKDANIVWDDKQQGVQYKISNANISTGELKFGEPINLAADLTLAASKPALSAAIQFKGTVAYEDNGDVLLLKPMMLEANVKGKEIPGGEALVKLNSEISVDLDKGVAQINTFDLNAFDTQLKGKVNASAILSGKPEVAGEININGKDLAQLLKIVEVEPLASQIETMSDKSFNINTVFDVDTNRNDVDLSKLDIALLGNTINAEVYGRNLASTTPAAKGKIKATGADLPALIKIASQFTGENEESVASLSKQLNAAPKPFDINSDFDVDLKAGIINIPALSIDALGFNVSGKVKGNNIQSNDGSLTGNLSINSKSPKSLLSAIGQADVAQVMKSININTGINGNASNFSLKPFSLEGVFSGRNIPGSPVTLSVKADSDISLDKEVFNLSGLEIKGLGLDVNGNIKATKFKTAPALSGDIAVAPFNLRQLMKSLNKELPETSDTNVFKKLGIATSFSGTTSSFALKGLKAELDETKLQGDIDIKRISPLDIEFGLGVDKLNADRYLPPKTDAKPVTPEAVAVGAATGLPVDMLRAIRVKGDFVMGQLTVSNAKLSDMEFSIRADKGDIKLQPINAKLYEGTYAGDIQIDAKGKLPKLVINSKLTGIQAEPLLDDVQGKAKLKGTGDFSAALTSTGADVEKLKQNLNGQMSFIFRDGAIKGFNIGKFLRGIKSVTKDLSLKLSDKEETDFAEISGNPKISNGIIRLDDLDGKSPGIRLSGKGELANLNNEKINYVAKATVVATSTGQGGKELEKLNGISIPVRIHGDLADPNIKPDIGEVAASFATKKVKDKLGDVLGDKLGITLPGATTKAQPAEQQQAPTQAQEKEAATEQQQAQPKDPVKELKDKVIKDVFDKLF